jgi:hypothetical protein
MAGVIIDVTISHGGSDLASDLDQMMDDSDLELVVVNGPGACGPCRANKNPHNVPCYECTGNILRIDSDDPGARNLCQCRVEVREKGDRS